MSKKLHVSFSFIAIVSTIAIILIASQTKKPEQVKKQIHPSLPAQQAVLTMSATQPKQDGNFTVFIKLQKNGHTPRLAQIELGYDPAIIQASQAYAGDIFTNPNMLLETINNNTGRISLAITCKPENGQKECINNTREIIAAIQFKQSGYTMNNQTQIQSLPKTMLLDADNHEIPIQKIHTLIQLQKAMSPIASEAAH